MRTAGNSPTEEQRLEKAQTSSTRAFLLRPFQSFGNRNFAIYWTSMFSMAWAMNMQMFMRSWYVYELTGQAKLIGVVALAQGIPVILFSLFGGAIADRLNKRTILITAYSCTSISTFVIAVVIKNGAIEWWHLVLSSVASGLGMAFMNGARQAVIPELVGRDRILNAVSLTNVAQNISRISAPAVAGFLVATAIGVSGVFFLMAGLLATSAVVLLVIPKDVFRQGERNQSFLNDVVEGLKYVKSHEVILWLTILFMVTAFFGMPYVYLLPVLAKEAWALEPQQIGLLFSAIGVGALIGSLSMASLGGFQRKGLLLLAMASGFGITVAALAQSPFYLIAFMVAPFLGAFQSSRMSLNSTLVQIHSPDNVRGRVMGVYHTEMGVHTLGVIVVGTLADIFSPQIALAASGIAMVVFVGYVYQLRSFIRKLT